MKVRIYKYIRAEVSRYCIFRMKFIRDCEGCTECLTDTLPPVTVVRHKPHPVSPLCS